MCLLYCRCKSLLILNDKLLGVCLKKPAQLTLKKQEISNEISTILKRRVAFELSSSSDESLYNSNTDEWTTL